MDRFLRLRSLLLALFAVFYAFAMTAAAQTPPPSPPPRVDVYATGIRTVGVTEGGVKAAATLEAHYTGTTGGVRNYNVPVNVSSGTLGSLARGAIGRGLGLVGWGLLFRDIINAAGWAIDELQDQVVTRPEGDPIPPGGMYWMDSIHGKPWSDAEAAGSYMAGVYTTNNLSRGYLYSYEGLTACTAPDPYGAFSCKAEILVDYRNGTTGYVYPGLAYVRNLGSNTITPTDLLPEVVPMVTVGEALKGHPEVRDGLLVDPITGSPHLTPELTAAINNLRRTLEALNGLSPGADVVPDPSSGANGTNGQSAWPSFCTWASAVCDWFRWTKEPAGPSTRPEDPWADDVPPDSQSWSSGIGGGSCPASVPFSVSLAGVTANPSFSFQPLCNFLLAVRPVVIAIATLYAAYIIAGLRSQKNV